MNPIHFIIACVTILVLLYVIRINIVHKQAKFIGRHGEKKVAKVLMQLPDEYTIFNDVYLLENDKSTQIDHVVLSPYGVFVIETKNYSGLIYGGEKAQYWTKDMFGTKYKFYNPLLQNYSHVRALYSLYGFPMQYFIPIVVFTNRAELLGDYSKHHVVYIDELISTIEAYQKVVFTESILADAIVRLSYSSFETSETVSIHKAQVKANIASYKMAVKEGVCPRCGGTLVRREGRYGSFWGCSNYPNCRFTLRT
ncbi:NERD domain-containing protein [Prevotella jejuni]|uniref:NERD domain-containing protein n=1 Tax=Prevotella jejuni TaxID=1177574 RepID=UPI001C5EEDAC|nr:NERD domain-containing protein [Prevotella jejuni]MBW4770309.1 NERD domain-containing protein [Prevotella jejuni]